MTSTELKPFDAELHGAALGATLTGADGFSWSPNDTWVALGGERIVGWVHAERRKLQGWHVEPSHRGVGLGRRLLERALDVHGSLTVDVVGEPRWRSAGLAALGFEESAEGDWSLKLPHAETAELEAGLRAVRQCSPEQGRVEWIARRTARREREVLDSAELCPERGLVGDHWAIRPSRNTKDGGPHPDMQLTLMNSHAAQAVAGSRERWALAGDQLFVDLCLSTAELPPGTQLRVGQAIIEVTDVPHTGCDRFAARFGAEAMGWTNTAEGQALNLRGINTRVIRAGAVQVGDPIERLASDSS